MKWKFTNEMSLVRDIKHEGVSFPIVGNINIVGHISGDLPD